MTRVNNINLSKIEETIKGFEKDPSSLKRVVAVGGEWVFEEGNPQFRGEVKYEKGSETLESDLPSFMGGDGLRPSPLHYCLYGLASCFAATIASIAAEKKIKLKSLSVIAEGHYDFRKTFGVGESPIVEEVVFRVKVEGECSEEELRGILTESEERCPAVNCLKNPVKTQVLKS